MRVWAEGAGAELVKVPRPLDAPRARAAGREMERVLLFGTGPAVGWGVSTHDLALPGALARAMSAQSGRGTTVDLAARPGLTAADAADFLLTVDLSRYDVVFVIIGVNDAVALTPVRSWREDLGEVLSILDEKTAPDARSFLVGIQPIRSIPVFNSRFGSVANGRARELNDASIALTTELGRTGYVALPAPPPGDPQRYRSPAAYVFWARTLATALSTPSAHREASIDRPTDSRAIASDEARWRTIDRLGLSNSPPNERLYKIVSIARRSLEADSAFFSVLEQSKPWIMAQDGFDSTEQPISQSLCTFAVREPDGMVVLDASLDPRFRDDESVVGGHRIRFYAGYPVEAPDGERIGALCVFDSKPRAGNEIDVDLDVLRELAFLAERELWRYES
jgi:GAF domain-containing protein